MVIERKDLLRYYGWSENPTIEECAEKAYIDLARPLNGISKMPPEEKEEYKKIIYRLIEKQINELLSPESSKSVDDWHNWVCAEIIKQSEHMVLNWIDAKKKWNCLPLGIA